MLHQLRARADQGKRSVPFVDRLHRVTFKVRQLQFDDIAIPRLGFLDLLMVAESRERRAEAMSAMFRLGVDAEPAQPTTERSVGQRYDMLPAGFHLGRRNGPALGIPIDLSPFHVVDDARARDGQCIESKGISDQIVKSGLLPYRHDQLEEANHILRLGDAGSRRRDVDSELLLAGPERIVAITIELCIVADLFTDAMDSVTGLQFAGSLHRPEESEHVRALDVFPIAFPEAIFQIPSPSFEQRDGLGTAHRDKSATLDLLGLLLCEPFIDPNAERTFSRLTMPFELLFDGGIDRRVLGEQGFCGVTLLACGREREGAVVPIAVRPRWTRSSVGREGDRPSARALKRPCPACLGPA